MDAFPFAVASTLVAALLTVVAVVLQRRRPLSRSIEPSDDSGLEEMDREPAGELRTLPQPASDQRKTSPGPLHTSTGAAQSVGSYHGTARHHCCHSVRRSHPASGVTPRRETANLRITRNNRDNPYEGFSGGVVLLQDDADPFDRAEQLEDELAHRVSRGELGVH